MDIYERIEFLMRNNNIRSFGELSQASGIPYTTLRNIFLRKSNIKANVLERLKVTLNTSFEYLVIGNENKPSQTEQPYVQQLFNILSATSQATAIVLRQWR